jgi:hypothetical protein
MFAILGILIVSLAYQVRKNQGLFAQILDQVRRPLDYLSNLEIVDGDTPYK